MMQTCLAFIQQDYETFEEEFDSHDMQDYEVFASQYDFGEESDISADMMDEVYGSIPYHSGEEQHTAGEYTIVLHRGLSYAAIYRPYR